MFRTCKRIAWEAYVDMPVGLTPRREAGTGTRVTWEILLSEPDLRDPGPRPVTAEGGWLLILGITNPGLLTVRGRDFTAPLTFAFPGREIHATQISPGPPARTASRTPPLPKVQVLTGNSRKPGPAAGSAARLQLSGGFLLRPGDGYAVMLVLAGTPADGSRPVQHEGSLTRGKILPASRPEPSR